MVSSWLQSESQSLPIFLPAVHFRYKQCISGDSDGCLPIKLVNNLTSFYQLGIFAIVPLDEIGYSS